MIIINSGIPKSGTSLLVAYQNDLIRSASPCHGIDEWQRHSHGGYVQTIDDAAAQTLRRVHDGHGDFVVKTHTGPTGAIRQLIHDGTARASFSFRDPRDVVLSALDHARRTRRGLDPSGAFGDLHSLSDAITFTRRTLATYAIWRAYGHATFIRYEDLMADKLRWLRKMVSHFGLAVSDRQLHAIYEKHERLKESAWNFNKGTTERWKSEMSAEDLALCEEAFGAKLETMGYERSAIPGR